MITETFGNATRAGILAALDYLWARKYPLTPPNVRFALRAIEAKAKGVNNVAGL